MAVGDVVSDLQSIANNAFLDLHPGSGVEWVIHNLGYGGAMELYFTDGTNLLKISADTVPGFLPNMAFHCTNGKYYRIKNVSGNSALLAYDGVQTK